MQAPYVSSSYYFSSSFAHLTAQKDVQQKPAQQRKEREIRSGFSPQDRSDSFQSLQGHYVPFSPLFSLHQPFISYFSFRNVACSLLPWGSHVYLSLFCPHVHLSKSYPPFVWYLKHLFLRKGPDITHYHRHGPSWWSDMFSMLPLW